MWTKGKAEWVGQRIIFKMRLVGMAGEDEDVPVPQTATVQARTRKARRESWRKTVSFSFSQVNKKEID